MGRSCSSTFHLRAEEGEGGRGGGEAETPSASQSLPHTWHLHAQWGDKEAVGVPDRSHTSNTLMHGQGGGGGSVGVPDRSHTPNTLMHSQGKGGVRALVSLTALTHLHDSIHPFTNIF
eukprot:76680-Chlamydomonas_euryale.AAC.1